MKMKNGVEMKTKEEKKDPLRERNWDKRLQACITCFQVYSVRQNGTLACVTT